MENHILQKYVPRENYKYKSYDITNVLKTGKFIVCTEHIGLYSRKNDIGNSYDSLQSIESVSYNVQDSNESDIVHFSREPSNENFIEENILEENIFKKSSFIPFEKTFIDYDTNKKIIGNHTFILKLSGIWENEKGYGITYKIIDSNNNSYL